MRRDSDLEPKEADAKPIEKNGTMGDLSVTWCKDLGLRPTTYDRAVPDRLRCVLYSRTPWGPWSEPQPIFNPIRDHAAGSSSTTRMLIRRWAFRCVYRQAQEGMGGTSGGFYAPYVVERFTKAGGRNSMSTTACPPGIPTWSP